MALGPGSETGFGNARGSPGTPGWGNRGGANGRGQGYGSGCWGLWMESGGAGVGLGTESGRARPSAGLRGGARGCQRSGGCQGTARDGAWGYRQGWGSLSRALGGKLLVAWNWVWGLGSLAPAQRAANEAPEPSGQEQAPPGAAPRPLTLGLHPPAADHAQVFPEVPGEESTRGC